MVGFPIGDVGVSIGDVGFSIHMGWRHVLFANWPVEPDVVEPHLPDPLDVETFDGQAWLSVVPFTNVDVRPAVLPRGTGFGLPELNLRTYVAHEDSPGVYFFSLDAQGLLGVLGARFMHHLPYYFARIDLSTEGRAVRFRSRRWHPGARPVRFGASYEPTGTRFTAEPGTLSAFLTERYRYFTEAPNGEIRKAEIEHDPWPLYEVDVSIPENWLFAANWFEHPETEPVHLYSPGVVTHASRSLPIE